MTQHYRAWSQAATVAPPATLREPVGPRVRPPADGPDDLPGLGWSDRLASEELFCSQYPRLAGWVRRLVDDDETAHEIASEAFTRLLSRWSRLDNPHSYLYMVATNLVRDHWRRAERERHALRNVVAAARVDDRHQPSGEVDLRAVVQTLPERLRSAFLLRYYAGFTVREVAVLLNRPEGTVKSDLYQARTRLKSALGGNDE